MRRSNAQFHCPCPCVPGSVGEYSAVIVSDFNFKFSLFSILEFKNIIMIGSYNCIIIHGITNADNMTIVSNGQYYNF